MRIYTGIIRKLDELGRVVIPKEIIRNFGFTLKEEVAISIDGNGCCEAIRRN